MKEKCLREMNEELCIVHCGVLEDRTQNLQRHEGANVIDSLQVHVSTRIYVVVVM